MSENSWVGWQWIFGVCHGLVFSAVVQADVVTFSSGSNTFTLDFQSVVNPGNVADSTGHGAVDYSFGISKFEISEEMIQIYNQAQTVESLKIASKNAAPGSKQAACEISWNEAAAFVNWLNTLQGESPAYNSSSESISGVAAWSAGQPEYDSNNIFRSQFTVFALPTLNEWYKAAYYDPSLNNEQGGYWKYGTRSNEDPTQTAGGTGANEAVYGIDPNSGVPADTDNAGGLSAYGVMGMSGNVWEWVETATPGRIKVDMNRYYAGGGFADTVENLEKGISTPFSSPGTSLPQGGFRVISLVHYTEASSSSSDPGLTLFGAGSFSAFGSLSTVPEPGTFLVCGVLGGLGLYRGRFSARRGRKAVGIKPC